VAGADCVILDGTFFHDDEMIRATGLPGRTARSMGHLPISESLERLGAHSVPRSVYTHLNNTNPLLDVGSPEHKRSSAVGAEVARDGMMLRL
jgi:pyrroloquinoline quinone biosynthesis protein B